MNQEEKVPKHIAIIMDGNGRWAKKDLCHVIMDTHKEAKQ